MDKVFSGAEKIKIQQLVKEGMQVMSEVEALTSGLSDTVKAIAEELEVKPSVLKRAIRIAHKASLGTTNAEHDALNQILETAGHTL